MSIIYRLAELGGSIASSDVEDWSELEAARRMGLVRFIGPAWVLTQKGWRLSGRKPPGLSSRASLLIGALFLALMILAVGESLDWWNFIRLGPDLSRSPAPTQGWERS